MTDVSIAEAEPSSARLPRARSVVFGLALLFVVTGVLGFAASGRLATATQTWPVDFDINWVAAHRLVDGNPLYDRVASRVQGMRTVDPAMRMTGHDPFSSFIGTPPVALTEVPLLPLGNYTGAQLFRLLSFLAVAAAVVITSRLVAPSARVVAAMLGIGVLLWTSPMLRSLALGQGTGLVTLALAVGIWGAARERWTVSGVGLGIAAVLKVSPVLLIVYLVLRGRRKVIAPAMLSALGCFAFAAAVGRPGDLLVWLRDVSPQVSKGSISGYNQSLVGALSRLTTSHVDLSLRVGPGGWFVLAYLTWASALVVLWARRRHQPMDPLELGVLVLILLLAGPLTWEHYYVWAIVPLVLVLDPRRWTGRGRFEVVILVATLVGGTLLLVRGIAIPQPAAIRADWWLRVGTSPYVVAAVLLTAASCWLLLRSPRGDPERAEWPDERDTAVGRALPMVATGVHERG